MADNSPLSAAAQTFAVPELLENILLHLPNEANTEGVGPVWQNDLQPQLFLFVLQRVNRNFRDLIVTSPSLQKKMLRPPSKRYTVFAQGAPSYARRFGLEPVFQRVRRLKPSKRADSRAQSWRKIRLHAEGEDEVRLQACEWRTWIRREMECKPQTWGQVMDWVWWSIDRQEGQPLRVLG